MNDQALSVEEQALADARARGDATITRAFAWIEEYGANRASAIGLRIAESAGRLKGAMQGRDIDAIEGQLSALLKVQGDFDVVQLGAPERANSATDSGKVAPAPPEFEQSEPHEFFEAQYHEYRSAERKRGPVFVSYARADQQWLARLRTHLRPMERVGRLSLWHDGLLQPGQQWRDGIEKALTSASSAILLVSANFMASDFIYANELPPIAERARSEGVVVFPLVVGHCLFDEDPYLSTFQLFNDPQRPLTALNSDEVDQTLVRLAKAVAALGVV